MFGTVTAGYFAFINFAWLQLASLEGRSLWSMDRVLLAASLASLPVTVHPLTIFVLVGIGLVLLYRRRFGAFLAAVAIALAIGFL